MTERRHRVLVVDDSAFARKVVREVLQRDPRLEVVGIARDGLDALEKIEQLGPDVITLDLVMPELDGVGVLRALQSRITAPRVVVVTMSDAESPLAVEALAQGAFDLVQKPTALATDRLYELGTELVEKVVVAASSLNSPRATRSVVAPKSAPSAKRVSLVAIGASTGGPRAVSALLGALPASFPVPIAIVVHMPVGYTEAFAARLDSESALKVREAEDGMPLGPGTVTIARAGTHLRVRASNDGLEAALDVRPVDSLHRPSVDVLFTSAANVVKERVLGVVLTGMGADGLEGARAIHEAGGQLIVEASSSCVVYGMPRAVAEGGLGANEVPLEAMATKILEQL